MGDIFVFSGGSVIRKLITEQANIDLEIAL